ncbi:EP300-interacting inhibitor of differentiation 3 isoform X2 [Thrips palmi]|uniref:Non-structural maintenance of chromosomes element 4 n=1 Tax=Thrips palmi TaxID=161013 RepID=A0A6P8YLE7_THRPL|nr:EP300-interacting inhibitor of differentiation 3 isoform X2 [Thrips palmi]
MGTPGGGGSDEALIDIYAKQYEEAQKILQDGLTDAESVAKVGQLLRDSSIHCKKEKKVRESLFGSSVLSLCAQISKNQALALDTNLSAFDVQAFADGILAYAFDGETETVDWDKLSKRASKMFKRSPAMSYMYGSFKATELPRKEPKERVRRQAFKATGEKKEPEKVTNVTATDEGNDKAVQHLKKVLKSKFRESGNQPIDFFKFVLDPTSFHRTVENIFHLSFLMKNNICAVRQDNGGGLPYIHYVSTQECTELQKGKKLQCILSITPEQWETLVEAFKVDKPMVPPLT